MTKSSLWLKGFLECDGRADAREQGRFLFTYRCSDDEYQSLRAALTEDLRIADLGAHLRDQSAGVFPALLFFAAEWFRREFGRGTWSWDGPLNAIGLNGEQSNIIHACGDRLEVAFAQYWHRPVIRYGGQRRFLWTVVREGGLPVQKLVESGVGHRLGILLRTLLDARWAHADAYLLPLAMSHATGLPGVLRDEAILGNLAQLAELLASHFESLRRGHGMRLLGDEQFVSRLPFVIDGDAAAELVKQLIEVGESAAKSVQAGRISVTLRLDHSEGHYSVSAEVGLPRRLAPAAIGLNAARSGRLYLQSSDGERMTLADFDPEPDGGLLLRVRANPFRVPRSAAGEQLVLVALCEGAEAGSVSLFEPSPLPWVFRQDGDGAWSFLRTAPCRSKSGALRLLVPSAYSVTGATEIGQVARLGRRVFEARERTVLKADDEEAVVLPLAPTEDNGEYVLRGAPSKWSLDGWLGPPEVFVRTDGIQQHVHNVEWRGDGRPVEQLSATSRGAGWLVVRDGKAIAFKRRATLFPASVRIAPHTSPDGRPALRFSGFGDARFRAEGATEAAPGSAILVFDSASSGTQARVSVAWADGGSLVLLTPVPGRMPVFRSASGDVWKEGQVVPLRGLRGAVAEAWPTGGDEFEVRVVVKDRDDKPLPSNFGLELSAAEHSHRLALDALEEPILTLFAACADVDASVGLELRPRMGRADQRVRITMPRFAGRLEPVRHRKLVKVANDPTSAQLEVRARPMTAPAAPELVLTQGPQPGTWSYDDVRINRGPWLLSAWDGSVQRLRPLLITVREGTEADPPATELARAVLIPDELPRRAAFNRVFDLLEMASATHPEWVAMNEYLDTLGTLPSTTFAVLAEFVRRPMLCALVLLRCSDNESRGRVLRRFEDLPMMWHLVPLQDWARAFQRIMDERNALNHILGPEDFGSFFEGHGESLSRIDPRFAALKCVFERVAVHLRLRKEKVPAPSAFDGLARADRAFTAFRLNLPQSQRGGLGVEQPSGLPEMLAQLVAVPDAIRNITTEIPVVDFYLAPRVAAVVAVRGMQMNARQTLALRLARGTNHQQAVMFNEVYASCLEALLADHNLNHWRKAT